MEANNNFEQRLVAVETAYRRANEIAANYGALDSRYSKALDHAARLRRRLIAAYSQRTNPADSSR